jgi:Family of unknown function (DUF6545)
MVKALLYAAPPILLWSAVLGTLPALRRHPNDPVRWAVWLALLTLAGAVTVVMPPVQQAVDRSVGVSDVALLLRHVLALGCACAAQAFLLYSSYLPEVAAPRVRQQVWALMGTLTAMTVLFVVGKAHHQPFDILGGYRTGRPVLLYWLLWLAYLGLALVNAARLLGRWARLSEGLLRPGLRLISVGAAIGLGYVGYHLAVLTTSQFGWPPRHLLGDQQLIIQGLTLASQLLLVVGLTLLYWGPRVGLPRLLRWLGHYRALRRLYPLWRELCQALPGVALELPTGVWRDRLRVRGLEFWLHRRVGEMRDAGMLLRPWRDPRAARSAAELGRQAGLDDLDLAAVVEAATLTAAAQLRMWAASIGEQLARQAGLDDEDVAEEAMDGPEALGPSPLEKVVEAATRAAAVPATTDRPPATGAWAGAVGPGGGDLDSESAWLGKVATARRSRLVRTVVAGQEVAHRPLLQRSAEQAAAAVAELVAAAGMVGDGDR